MIFTKGDTMPSATEMLRSLEEQGLVERSDLEETDGNPAKIVRNVLLRLNPDTKSKRDDHHHQKDQPV